MEKLTPLSKVLIAAILVGSGVTAFRTHGKHSAATAEPAPKLLASSSAPLPAAAPPVPLAPRAKSRVRVGLSQWPGHMALLLAAGGLTTQPGSPADKLGLDLEIVFLEDAPTKN